MNTTDQDNLTQEGYIDRSVYLRIRQFTEDRDWGKYHSPKDLAISLSLEASELLECFQWSGEDTWVQEQRAHIIEEIADVFIYACQMCQVLGINPNEIITRKLNMNENKYPIDLAYGKSEKYSSLTNLGNHGTVEEAPSK